MTPPGHLSPLGIAKTRAGRGDGLDPLGKHADSPYSTTVNREHPIVVVGGGIVGLATALALAGRGERVVVLEAEAEVAQHQSGRNSGVVHAGLYYPPQSLKARLCRTGREKLFAFCQRHGVTIERCGKLVVAVDEQELPALDALATKAYANGLSGVERLDADGIRAREPYVRGVAALWIPQTGIVDFGAVARAYARVLQDAGAEIRTGTRLLAAHNTPEGLAVETSSGSLTARYLINCAGLQSDRVARCCGVDPGIRIVPFRGSYLDVAAEYRHLINNLVYPVPDPRFPFLGVHLTRTIHGGLHAGPNAVLTLHREGYAPGRVSPRDVLSYLTYPGFWRFVWHHRGTAVTELPRTWRHQHFTHAVQRLVPSLPAEALRPAASGIRAQAVDTQGKLLDDFHIVRGARSLHVLNAPSPAATASLAIGEYLAELVG